MIKNEGELGLTRYVVNSTASKAVVITTYKVFDDFGLSNRDASAALLFAVHW
jgi:hypothetical protein